MKNGKYFYQKSYCQAQALNHSLIYLAFKWLVTSFIMSWAWHNFAQLVFFSFLWIRPLLRNLIKSIMTWNILEEKIVAFKNQQIFFASGDYILCQQHIPSFFLIVCFSSNLPFVIASYLAIQLVITVSLLRPSISGRVRIRWENNINR